MALLNQTMTLPPPKESNFNMSHKHRTDIAIGMATPILTQECIPGDVIDCQVNAKLITDSLVTPCWGQFRLQIDHFFVPNRIVWSGWTDFIRQSDEDTTHTPWFNVPFDPNRGVYAETLWNDSLADTAILSLIEYPGYISEGDGYNYTDWMIADIDYIDRFASYLNAPWINGFDEREFSFCKLQDQSTETLVGDSYNSTINRAVRAVSNRSPYNIVRPGSLINYLGLPAGYYGDGIAISALPLLAYNKIWYEWYRNPQESQYVFQGDAEVFKVSSNLDDYISVPSQVNGFTRQFTNDEMEIIIDFESWMPSLNLGFNIVDYPEYADYRQFLFSLKKRCYKHDYLSSILNANNYDQSTATVTVSGNQFTINQWRQAMHVDKYQKRKYIGGDRYIDWIRAQFGVIDSDARLQRPELMMSTSSSVIFVDVESQADTETAKLGQLGSRGISLNESPESCRFRATEHGYYFVIASLVPIVDNVDGLDKSLTKVDSFDYFVPALDNIDMQPVHLYEFSSTDEVSKALASDELIALKVNLRGYKPGNNISETSSTNNEWTGYLTAKRNYLLGDSPLYPEIAVGYLPCWSEYKTRMNRVSGLVSTQRQSWMLSRPNVLPSALEEFDEFRVKQTFGDTTVNATWNGISVNAWDESYLKSFLAPVFDFANKPYISQYVDPRDFAYLWPDVSARFNANSLQIAFDLVMRRPMALWSIPV